MTGGVAYDRNKCAQRKKWGTKTIFIKSTQNTQEIAGENINNHIQLRRYQTKEQNETQGLNTWGTYSGEQKQV